MKIFGSERVNQEGGEGKVRLRSVGTWLGGLVVVGLILVGAGSVAAQTTSQVINACYQKQTGVLEILISGSCDPKTETAISWNQVGPQGPQGEQGPQGPQGEQGPQGPQGPSGISGYTRSTNHGSEQDDYWDATTIGARSLETAHAECPEGTRVLGGGAYSFDKDSLFRAARFEPGMDDFSIRATLDTAVDIKSSAPYETAGGDSGWMVVAFNHDFSS